MLEILADQLAKAIDLGMSPHMGAEPGELVGWRSPEGCPYNNLIWI
jgi:hypothetical protein